MKKFAFVAALSVCAVTLISLAPAQNMKPDPSKRIAPTVNRFEVKAAVERTPEQMDAFEATAIAPENRTVPVRPTMDAAQYAQLKQAAALAPRAASRPGTSAPTSPLAAVSLAFGGATECDNSGTGFGCWQPPDVAGSIGKSQFVSVSNNTFEVRSRTGALLKSKSLNSFFGYKKKAMFDPRVQYDEEYQRWIVTADAFAESGTVQVFGIAISKTNSATGAFYIYFINTNGFTGAGNFYDYPMLGLSQDAVLFTANAFQGNSFLGSTLFSVAKARLYNGYGWGVPVFTGLIGTMEPAHQLLTDQNGDVWYAAAPGNSGAIDMVYETFPANPGQTGLFGYYGVTGVPAYTIPPSAAQPAGCGGFLDTLDNRFQNAGTQSGDLYYQAHTVNDSGFPTVRYYVISGLSTLTPTVALTNLIFNSGSSNDWNPSIAADPEGRFGINWSLTNPPAGQLPSEYFADNNGSNPGPGSGINVFTSASCYNNTNPPPNNVSRWGDYSQTSVDPGTGAISSTNTGIFWTDNETVPSVSFWSTEVGEIVY
jgi:hypothetical protein